MRRSSGMSLMMGCTTSTISIAQTVLQELAMKSATCLRLITIKQKQKDHSSAWLQKALGPQGAGLHAGGHHLHQLVELPERLHLAEELQQAKDAHEAQ